MQIAADELLRRNVQALLNGRKESQKALAMWMGHSAAWLNKILNAERGCPVKYLDRLADFFGLAPYQLLQPGISALTERRKGERRDGRDRRIGHAGRLARGLELAIAPHRPYRGGDHVASAEGRELRLEALVAEFEQRAATLLAETEPRGQAPAPRARPARRRSARGKTGGSDA